MKIMVISDTHGNYLAPLSLLDDCDGVDLVIHLGDEINDAKLLQELITTPVLMVPGNCDIEAREPRELSGNIGGQVFFITHGDRYGVKNSLESLIKKGAAEKATIVLYGHTHSPSVRTENGMLLLNPGSLATTCMMKSYALITLSGKNVEPVIINVAKGQQPQPQL